MSEVITFTSGKGGVGKTTTTANVGVGLSLLENEIISFTEEIPSMNDIFINTVSGTNTTQA